MTPIVYEYFIFFFSGRLPAELARPSRRTTTESNDLLGKIISGRNIDDAIKIIENLSGSKPAKNVEILSGRLYGSGKKSYNFMFSVRCEALER